LIPTGEAAQKQDAATKQYGKVPQENYKPFVSATGSIPLELEPPNAQQIYAVLDVAMQKVSPTRPPTSTPCWPTRRSR
jgi:multiple sugar transport system substrate-binding protein